MENILLVFVCLLIGIALQRVKEFNLLSYKTLNQYVIYVSLPALGLYFIPEIEINAQLLYPIGIAWLGFLGAYLFFTTLGRWLNWPDRIIGCLILTAGMGNTAFVGFPIVEALYGVEGLKTAILVDQPGTFVVFSTLGIIVASKFSRSKSNSQGVLKKIFTFPPFIIFMIALLMNVFGLHFSELFKLVFQKIGSTVTPVSLVAVGLQLQFNKQSRHWGFLGIGLLFKLILTPLFFYVFYVLILKGSGLPVQVSITQAAMGPMISGAILATTYGLKPKLSSMMVGFGIPLSFITIFLWYLLIRLI